MELADILGMQTVWKGLLPVTIMEKRFFFMKKCESANYAVDFCP